MAKAKAREDATVTGGVDPEPDGDAIVEAMIAGLDDGEVTFTRPGIESMTFQVKNGKISTTKSRHQWLLQHVAGVGPAEEPAE